MALYPLALTNGGTVQLGPLLMIQFIKSEFPIFM